MSDLFEVRKKVEEGASWRGSIQVNVDGESKDLTVRQLRDNEFWDVMSDIDVEELENLQQDVPEDLMDEFNELQGKDELDDEEQERLEEIQEEMEDGGSFDMFDSISKSTYDGLKKCAIYGIEPDEQDIQHVLTQNTEEINEKYGGTSRDDARKYVKDHVVKPTIEDSTDFVSFAIGVRVFQATLDDAGN